MGVRTGMLLMDLLLPKLQPDLARGYDTGSCGLFINKSHSELISLVWISWTCFVMSPNLLNMHNLLTCILTFHLTCNTSNMALNIIYNTQYKHRQIHVNKHAHI